MSVPPVATPGSTGDSATPSKPNAPKNKQCPFCGDHFTSSSLGRHLDLYIKDKNPKNSDGVHDVEEIRRLRANITRRQPRRSVGKREGSTPVSQRHGASHGNQSPFIVKAAVSGAEQPGHFHLNKPTWEATGVMTDIPTASLNHNYEPISRKVPNRSDQALKKRMVEDHTRMRAAELALQEVLDSINAAK